MAPFLPSIELTPKTPLKLNYPLTSNSGIRDTTASRGPITGDFIVQPALFQEESPSKNNEEESLFACSEACDEDNYNRARKSFELKLGPWTK